MFLSYLEIWEGALLQVKQAVFSVISEQPIWGFELFLSGMYLLKKIR